MAQAAMTARFSHARTAAVLFGLTLMGSSCPGTCPGPPPFVATITSPIDGSTAFSSSPIARVAFSEPVAPGAAAIRAFLMTNTSAGQPNLVDISDKFTITGTGAVASLDALVDGNVFLSVMVDREGDGVFDSSAAANFQVAAPRLVHRASGVVSADLGGLISIQDETSPNFGLELRVPPGAVAVDTEITISDVVENFPPPAANQTPPRPPVVFTPNGLHFLQPATLSFAWTPENLTSARLSSSDYFVGSVFDEESGRWVELEAIEQDPAAGTLSVQVNHFSGFGLFSFWRSVTATNCKEGIPNPTKEQAADCLLQEKADKLATIFGSAATVNNILELAKLPHPSFGTYGDGFSWWLTARSMSKKVAKEDYASAVSEGLTKAATASLKLAQYPGLSAWVGLTYFVSTKLPQLVAHFVDEMTLNNWIIRYREIREWGDSPLSHEQLLSECRDSSDPSVLGICLPDPGGSETSRCLYSTKYAYAGARCFLEDVSYETTLELARRIYEAGKQGPAGIEADLNGLLEESRLAWATAYSQPQTAILASFTVSADSGSAPFPVTFDASGSRGANGAAITEYHWAFQDGAAAGPFALAITHSFKQPGDYAVELRIVDASGNSAYATHSITVLAPPRQAGGGQPPTARGTATVIDPINIRLWHFDARGSTDPDGSIRMCRWSFGDGSTSSECIADHLYAEEGIYSALLQVWDQDFSRAEATVRVEAQSAVGLTIDWVTVGSPGNAADTNPVNCGPSSTSPCGAVATSYRIGKYEVTNAQYTEFLNKVAATDTNALYNGYMGSDATFGGITRSGVSGSYSYSVKPGFASKPVTWVSFWDAARFANWLHNGQPMGLQTSLTTEDGAYTLTPAAIAANSVLRNPTASVFLPSESEWYKAAYYDPIAGLYYDYPTGTNTMTGCVAPGSDTGNSANCSYDAGSVLTNVGAYSLSDSPSGTFDQGGNVLEWHEQIKYPSNRGLRGGAWYGLAAGLAAGFSGYVGPAFEGDSFGFRVASIPSPQFTDDFNDNQINPLRWRAFPQGTGPTASETNQRLEVTLPSDSADDPQQGVFRAGYASVCNLRGDFDIQVDYDTLLWPSANGVRIGLGALGEVERISLGNSDIGFPGQLRENYVTHFGDGIQWVPTADTAGSLRLARLGGTVTGYYLNNGSWVAIHSAPASSADTGFSITAWSHNYAFSDQLVRVAFDNFVVNQGELVCQ